MGRFSYIAPHGRAATLLKDKNDNARLPHLVQEAGLRWWTSNDDIPSVGPRFVVGVAIWSGYDMELMDALEEAAATLQEQNIPVEIFDMDSWLKAGDLNKYVPGIDEAIIFHSPLVGVWRNGELTEKAEGYKARELVYDLLQTVMGRDMRPVYPKRP